VAADSDVGLSTSSPAAALHVRRNGSNPMLRLEETGAAGAVIMQMYNSNSGAQWQLQAQSDGRFFINDRPGDAGDGVDEFLLDADGNLTLSGTITVPGGTLPDYVFAPDYELMPLSELAEFVDRERHLPNVPSASDVSRDGLNMPEMQRRLLEKVEELALYTLDQEETIKVLQARLAALESEETTAWAREALETWGQ
jgi:hypothetical protein